MSAFNNLSPINTSFMSAYTPKERELIQQAYEAMLVDIRPHVFDPKQLKTIDDAYRLALEQFDGKHLLSGKAYLLHLIDLARIVVLELGLGYMSVVASLLHGITYKTGFDIKEVEKMFGKRIAVIMTGFDRISELHTEKVAFNSDNFRDLFLSMVDDMRSVLLKLAHRVYDVRNQEDVDEDRLGKYFHEIKYIYIPITHRLGLYKIKAELEESLLLYENPGVYRDIQTKIEATKEGRQETVNRFLAPIIKELDKKFKYEIKWRIKSIPSIYAKMKAKDVPFEEVYDLLAARVIIDCPRKNEIESCWMAYSIITNIYEPNPDRLRDWITKPKASGYESLHTTVKYDDKLWFEIQIRSKRMDEIAETGQAAHYLYKGEKGNSEDWLLNVRKVLENPDTVSFETSYAKQYNSDKIFIFTPEGDLKRLPAGATVLDFAYEIHTRVGETCNGAKVNGRVVPIRHVLTNGDRVEIMTNRKQSPNADWLNWVVTDRSRTKIRRFLIEEELKESEVGKGLLFRRLKNWKLPINGEVIEALVKEFKAETSLELYHLIALEKIDLADIKHFLTEEMDAKSDRPERPAHEQNELAHKESTQDLDERLSIGEDIDNLNFKLASCCNPKQGDKVFGFVTSEGTISIHREDCPNAASMQERYGYRIINVTWNNTKE